ncbi:MULTISPECIES: hypothetical protein [unclassified Mesorhizobium]|uniref:hypothetical protein n=1 Tax=unclassified Mesorhizobium TaxID=325217 RepID=UPI000FCB1411|nr:MULTISPECIES: hypothetical protein [unclassified Mesorhizobium]TGP24053.1 hypothetical protein EN874_010130 [Mesorhizobium sp. M1D.F.Ca.ET.231.01.1.1]TGP35360.1 hypothetical protein EN877_11965 [Mesorhizobium sp. M1D.F.Ca.ET.234.01.1.1]TGS49382.1 hypothetical protein EN827_11960 [Mesorhizobium sp. M1D.F.Ca.ET.184.01.1.1]TGS63579.1 hypothetical protein EN826_011960 [Mesorhizobium sp. M1D.F.Ca.ET.183.01.1.1]
MFRALITFLLVSLLTMDTAWSRPATGAEKAALAIRVQEFTGAFAAKDMDHVFGMMSPRIVDYLVSSGGISVDELKRRTNAAWAEALKTVTLESFSMDMAKAEYLELSNGTPYGLIPTETVMSFDQDGQTQRMAVRARTLAVLDGGKWYLVRIDDPKQLMILRKTYPEFEDVELPRGTMEALK